MLELGIGVLGFIGGLAGAWFGHWLTQRATLDRERRDRQERHAKVRLLLRREIRANKRAVAAWWQLTGATPTEHRSPEGEPEAEIDKARRMAQRAAPPRERLVWERHADTILDAIGPHRLEAAARFYEFLDELVGYRERLVELGAAETPGKIITLIAEWWPRITELVEEIEMADPIPDTYPNM